MQLLSFTSTCGPYLEKGYCNKLVCRKRHPKRCSYFDRGYCKRNNECRYLHKSQVVNKCKKCAQVSNITYFCEFCNESFCGQCIVEEAHIYRSDKLGRVPQQYGLRCARFTGLSSLDHTSWRFFWGEVPENVTEYCHTRPYLGISA